MLVKHQHRKATCAVRPGATQRLKGALETLTRQAFVTALTAAELCRVAGVSRNSLYRYHAPILRALREHQRSTHQDPQVSGAATHRERRIA